MNTYIGPLRFLTVSTMLTVRVLVLGSVLTLAPMLIRAPVLAQEVLPFPTAPMGGKAGPMNRPGFPGGSNS